MAKGSRDKGNRGELEVCRLLSSWWMGKDMSEEDATDLPFRRSPLSGGWDRKKAAGDIIKPDHCTLCVEVKNREEWEWDHLFKPETKAAPLVKYWEQTVLAAKEKNEVPVLLFTKNFHPWYVRLEHALFVEQKIPYLFSMAGYKQTYGLFSDFLKSDPFMFTDSLKATGRKK